MVFVAREGQSGAKKQRLHWGSGPALDKAATMGLAQSRPAGLGHNRQGLSRSSNQRSPTSQAPSKQGLLPAAQAPDRPIVPGFSFLSFDLVELCWNFRTGTPPFPILGQLGDFPTRPPDFEPHLCGCEVLSSIPAKMTTAIRFGRFPFPPIQADAVGCKAPGVCCHDG